VKWKLTRPELERLATLLVESVHRGVASDQPLRDQALDLLWADRQRRQAAPQQGAARHAAAAEAAQRIFRRTGHKGI